MWLNIDAFEKAGLSTTDPPKTWKQIRAAAEKLKAASATPVAVTTSWPTWVMFERWRRCTTCPSPPWRTASRGWARAAADQPALRQAHGVSAGAAEGRHVPLRRPRQCRRRLVRLRRVRRSASCPRRCALGVAKEGKFKCGLRPAALLCRRHAAPQNAVHRRRQPLGDDLARPTPAEYKGVAKFFRSISDADSDVWQPQGDRLPADHHGGLREDRESGLLQGEPRHRRRHQRR